MTSRGTFGAAARLGPLLALGALLALSLPAAAQTPRPTRTAFDAHPETGLPRAAGRALPAAWLCRAGDGSLGAFCPTGAQEPAASRPASATVPGPWALAAAEPQARGGRRTRVLVGAAVGLVAGGVGTYLILNSGGSTAPCDRERNQDAMRAGECALIAAGGAAAGAGLGALVGWLIP